MWTLAVHNNVAQFLLNGVLIAATSETADLCACVGNLKLACSEEFFHVNFCIYNLSNRPLHGTTWDNLQWPFAVCTSSVRVCPDMCRLHRVHRQVPFLLKWYVF